MRVRLAVAEIGRGAEGPAFKVYFPPYTLIPARVYFSAIDAFGSPAFSESQLATSKYGVTADRLLVQAEGIELKLAASGSAHAHGGCSTMSGGQPEPTALALAPGRYTLTASGSLGATTEVARFARLPGVRLGVLIRRVPASLTLPHDRSIRLWHIYSQGAVIVCAAAAG